MEGFGGRGLGEGEEGLGGGDRGHFIHLAMYCTTNHMVLRPKGTSHNDNHFFQGKMPDAGSAGRLQRLASATRVKQG